MISHSGPEEKPDFYKKALRELLPGETGPVPLLPQMPPNGGAFRLFHNFHAPLSQPAVGSMNTKRSM